VAHTSEMLFNIKQFISALSRVPARSGRCVGDRLALFCLATTLCRSLAIFLRLGHRGHFLCFIRAARGGQATSNIIGSGYGI
jgi:hypothetical protein